MIKKCEILQLNPLTCHAAISYLDRLGILYAYNKGVEPREFQYITVICILLSGNYLFIYHLLSYLISFIYI